MLPKGGTGGQEKSDQRKGENRKGNKAEKRKQRRTEEKERQKKKNAPKENGRRAMAHNVPRDFRTDRPDPGAFFFSAFSFRTQRIASPVAFSISASSFCTRNPVSLTRFRFSLRFLPPLRHRPDPCVTRIGISMYRCGCIATSRCTDIRVSAS